MKWMKEIGSHKGIGFIYNICKVSNITNSYIE